MAARLADSRSVTRKHPASVSPQMNERPADTEALKLTHVRATSSQMEASLIQRQTNKKQAEPFLFLFPAAVCISRRLFPFHNLTRSLPRDESSSLSAKYAKLSRPGQTAKSVTRRLCGGFFKRSAPQRPETVSRGTVLAKQSIRFQDST